MTCRRRIVCVKSGSIALRVLSLDCCGIGRIKKNMCHVNVLSKLPGLDLLYDSGISWLHSIWCSEKDKIRPRILKELDGPQYQW